MKKIFTFLYHISTYSILYLSLTLIALLSYLCLRYRAFITLTSEAFVLFNNNIIFIILLIAIIFLIVKSGSLINYIPAKKLFIFLTFVYITVGIYFIFNADNLLRDDARYVYDAAISINNGDYKALLEGQYFFYLPHQLGLLTYDRILLLVNESSRTLFTANLVWVILINLILAKIYKLLFPEDSNGLKYTIILSFAFLPQFLFILFAYGTIPGFFFFIASVYFMLLYLIKNKSYALPLNILFLLCACLIRLNYLIGAIATIIIYTLNMLKEKKFHNLIIIFIILINVLFSQKALENYYSVESGMKINDGAPKILWVAMGLTDNPESPRAGGWFHDYYPEKTYQANDYDSSAASKVAQKDILNQIDNFVENPYYAYIFFKEKIISTWCDPMFQSVWSGPLMSRQQKTYSPILANLYNGGMIYKITAYYSNILVCIIYLFTFIFLFPYTKDNKKKLAEYTLVFPLFLIGTFLFHLIWETKSQYVYQAVISLVPLAAHAISMATKKSTNR